MGKLEVETRPVKEDQGGEEEELLDQPKQVGVAYRTGTKALRESIISLSLFLPLIFSQMLHPMFSTVVPLYKYISLFLCLVCMFSSSCS